MIVSVVLLLLVVNVPFLQPIFNTHYLSLTEWVTVVGLAVLPAFAEELTKAYLRWRDGQSITYSSRSQTGAELHLDVR